jgi:hypothetical protein
VPERVTICHAPSQHLEFLFGAGQRRGRGLGRRGVGGDHQANTWAGAAG